MKIIAAGRRGGKTEQIVKAYKECKEAGKSCAIVVINEQERRRLIREYQIPDMDVVVFMQEVSGHSFLLGRGRSYLFIDNADMILQSIFSPNPIAAISVEQEADNEN